MSDLTIHFTIPGEVVTFLLAYLYCAILVLAILVTDWFRDNDRWPTPAWDWLLTMLLWPLVVVSWVSDWLKARTR